MTCIVQLRTFLKALSKTLHNESLEHYYKVGNTMSLAVLSSQFHSHSYQTQCILPEDEWDDFMRSCKTVLPSSFRITNKPCVR